MFVTKRICCISRLQAKAFLYAEKFYCSPRKDVEIVLSNFTAISSCTQIRMYALFDFLTNWSFSPIFAKNHFEKCHTTPSGCSGTLQKCHSKSDPAWRSFVANYDFVIFAHLQNSGKAFVAIFLASAFTLRLRSSESKTVLSVGLCWRGSFSSNFKQHCNIKSSFVA